MTNAATECSSKNVHFIGIGGIGMSAIAKVLLEDGYTVSGSDLSPSPLTEALAAQGARIFKGHSAANVGDPCLVVISSAVAPDNPEVQEAQRRGIPVIKRAEMLGRLMAEKISIGIAGTHGKTTTSALVTVILERAGMSPTFLVGGEIIELGTNARRGSGRFLVAEADEYDASFLKLAPRVAVVTNIEPEHLDFYHSFEAVREAFRRFMVSVPASGHVIACVDDEAVRTIIQRGLTTRNISGYGFRNEALWRATDLRPNSQGGSDFRVERKTSTFGEFTIQLPGKHNVSNAVAAIVVGYTLSIKAETIRRALAGFRGARRRFEIKGEFDGVLVIDDYAHHPTEIRATLAAARERYGSRKIACIFQPHTYSRTKTLLNDFAACFEQADEVVIVDIYAAREKDTGEISSADLAKVIQHPNVRYVGDVRQAVKEEMAQLRSGDVLLAMGAGDIDRKAAEVLAEFQKT
ncbi:MAG: UDP-N-acetylmuramate--L-alanine ligase [Chloroflexi bacterium]|nr:UDP-N-acetylmuramate--L-alanine ligase [Chloroflexota bacterium]